MYAYLDPTVGGLDTILAEPLRVWSVTGTDEAIEAFRKAIGGIVIPDGEIVTVQDAEAVAEQVKQKSEQVAVLQASLDTATAELTDLQKVVVPVIESLKSIGG